jgi:predicted nucleotidyltransferase
MTQDLEGLVARLKQAAGRNLVSVVLYGSAVTGEFHIKHSDLNVLCVLESLDGGDLEKLNGATSWWFAQGHPAPLVFTLEELRRSADVFAIELLDIKANNRVLLGDDVFAGLDVPMSLHHLQVERELRTNLVRLRQHYLTVRQEGKRSLKLMNDSISSFTSLFRHALIALGELSPSEPHQPRRAVVDRLAALLGFDASAFHDVLELREGKRSYGHEDVQAVFRTYVDAVVQVVNAIDRRLDPSRP